MAFPEWIEKRVRGILHWGGDDHPQKLFGHTPQRPHGGTCVCCQGCKFLLLQWKYITANSVSKTVVNFCIWFRHVSSFLSTLLFLSAHHLGMLHTFRRTPIYPARIGLKVFQLALLTLMMVVLFLARQNVSLMGKPLWLCAILLRWTENLWR